MLVNDLVRYCAKFPPRDRVLNTFVRSIGTIEGYESLRQYVADLPSDGLIPGLNDFVLANFNETKLGDKIRSVKGYFMMLEYGIMRATSPGEEGARQIELMTSVHFGKIANIRDMDGIEEALIMDKCQENAILFIQAMQTDDAFICAHKRMSVGSMTLVPIDPALLYGAIGWSLTFDINDNTLF